MKIIFEWDINKARTNLRKHGVSFADAKVVFSDPRALTYRDDFHSTTEGRLITIGKSTGQRVLLVVHTEREAVDADAIIRIISARKATRNERKEYEND